jgi:hypothetical protein
MNGPDRLAGTSPSTSTLTVMARVLLAATGAPSLLLAVAFYLQWPPALALWPWPGGRLSNVFLASILAAAGAPVLWIGLRGEAAASPAAHSTSR